MEKKSELKALKGLMDSMRLDLARLKTNRLRLQTATRKLETLFSQPLRTKMILWK